MHLMLMNLFQCDRSRTSSCKFNLLARERLVNSYCSEFAHLGGFDRFAAAVDAITAGKHFRICCLQEVVDRDAAAVVGFDADDLFKKSFSLGLADGFYHHVAGYLEQFERAVRFLTPKAGDSAIGTVG